MSHNTNFNSLFHENRWILTIDSYFSKDHVVDIDLQTTTCVFRVPKTTADTKPQAYAPRRLALGPYHHFRPDFYKMKMQKISRVRRFLGPDKLEAFKQIVGVLVQREPVVRACYDEYLDFDIKTLARILAVDALYLLQLLDARKNGEVSDEMLGNVDGDILMVENQIPVVLFKVILQVLQLHEISSPERVLSTEFGEFCRSHSPLDLDQTRLEWVERKQLHLLDRMYHSIVINRGNGLEQISTDMINGSAEHVTEIHGVYTDAPQQILALVARARKFREQLKGGGGGGGEEVAYSPSAFELSESSGVKLERTAGGIRDIMYYAEGNCLQLPTMRLDANSEVVLRNLVAYEAAAGATHELAEYLDLMCGLIRTNKDVDTLLKAGIIVGELSEEETVGVFDGIERVMGANRKRQYIALQVGEDVGKSYDGKWSVKVKRFGKNCSSLLIRALTLVGAVAVLTMLVLQAFCSAFACDRWVGRGAVVQGFGLVYADH